MAKTTQPRTIMIVDDGPHNVVWLMDFLESKSFEVRLASNSVEALMLTEKEIYRTLIIDLNIPVTEPYQRAVLERGALTQSIRVCLSLKKLETVDIGTGKS
jgi:DNA-binding response OmpR family regulator